jgi:SAM-dependent methyltransferase
MRERLLDLIWCPLCRGHLLLEAGASGGGHVLQGILRCGCGQVFPVRGGVPRLLPPDLDRLQHKTIDNFGFEWTEWGRYGWGADGRPSDEERRIFWQKSLLRPEALGGKVALDAGCGNGRYAWFAAQHARDVIAVDLGPAVDSAFRNLGALPNVHVIQGDLFRLPVRDAVVDVVFSIGVLMHTGDAHRATTGLARLLAPGGSLTVHLYHKGNPIYELNDAALRALTTRLSIPTLQRIADGLARLGTALDRRGWLGYANLLLRLMTDSHTNFDWYAAPVATHHTYPEVFSWFDELGLRVVADNRRTWQGGKPVRPGLRGRLGRLAWRDWALTVRGEKGTPA